MLKATQTQSTIIGRRTRGSLAGARGVIVLVLLAAAFAVSQAPASAATPQPSYTATCSLAGQTTVTWAHSRVTHLQIDWYNPNTTIQVIHPTVSSNAPKGSLSASTPVGATMVAVSFYTDTTENSLIVACS